MLTRPTARVASTVGELHAQLAQLSGGYHAELAANVLAVLERRAVDFKEYEKVLKEAEKKRSVLDAVMTKVRTLNPSRPDYFQCSLF